MMLSQTEQYALRVMTSVALSKGACPVRAKDISARIKCPTHYVSKVLRKLVKAGLLKAEKGHGGGFVLARPADRIFFTEILEAVKGKTESKKCIFGWKKCDAKNPCILHHRWNVVSNSFIDWTKETSLSDIQNDAALMASV